MLVMYSFSLAQIINICYNRPYADGRPKNYQEICNEVFIMLISYSMICLTDFVESIEAQQYAGHVAYALIFLHLLVNLFQMLVQSGRQLSVRIKACLIKHEKQKKRKQVKERPAHPHEANSGSQFLALRKKKPELRYNQEYKLAEYTTKEQCVIRTIDDMGFKVDELLQNCKLDLKEVASTVPEDFITLSDPQKRYEITWVVKGFQKEPANQLLDEETGHLQDLLKDLKSQEKQ